MTPDDLMRRAITLSPERMQSGSGGPLAAVIARAGRSVAGGWSRVTFASDPTARAEKPDKVKY